MFNNDITTWRVTNVWDICNCIRNGQREIIMELRKNEQSKERKEINLQAIQRQVWQKINFVSTFFRDENFFFRMSQSEKMSCTIWSRSTIELVQTLQVGSNERLKDQCTYEFCVRLDERKNVWDTQKMKVFRWIDNRSVKKIQPIKSTIPMTMTKNERTMIHRVIIFIIIKPIFNRV